MDKFEYRTTTADIIKGYAYMNYSRTVISKNTGYKIVDIIIKRCDRETKILASEILPVEMYNRFEKTISFDKGTGEFLSLIERRLYKPFV